MTSVFTKILNKEIPGDIVYEDEKYFAILDINPIRDGHTLVIPKREVEYIFDLSEDEYSELMQVARRVANILTIKLKSILDFDRIAMIVEGLQVPHVHVHLVPLIDNEPLTIGRKTKLELHEVRKILLSSDLV